MGGPITHSAEPCTPLICFQFVQAAAAEAQAAADEAEEELRAVRDGTADKQDSLRCVQGRQAARFQEIGPAGRHSTVASLPLSLRRACMPTCVHQLTLAAFDTRRAEIEAQEAVIDQLERRLADAERRAGDASARATAAEAAAAEKEGMIAWVGEEVGRVKALFDQKVGRACG